MSNDWFFEKFALIANAPGAVARMRGLILDLAVQGNLVPQDPNEEPVGYWEEYESDFEIPPNWRWKRLGSLGQCRTGRTPSTSDSSNYGEGFPFIGPGQITQNGGFTAPEKTITLNGLDSTTEAIKSDILMVCIGGSIGKAAICRERLGFNQQINSLRLERDNPKFVYLAVTSGYFQCQVMANASGSATPIINKGKWERILIPLPPLAEQRRIVAKVDELMGICDALEAQQRERESRKSVLVRASLSRFSESPTPENLGYLFHKSYDIPPSELRKSILTLAVQGLLVAHESESPEWETRKLKDLTTKIGSGSTPSGGKESYQASGVPLIRSMNVHFGGFVRQGLVFLNDEQAEKLKNVAVKADDVLLNITGASIGRVATAPRNMEGARVNQHVCIVRPTSAITPQFLELFLASPVVQNLIDAVQVGATREALTKTMIEQFEIPVPSVGEQRRIVAKVDQLMALVDELERQQEASCEKATKLLDAIVQEMTSGGRDIAATLES